MTTPGADASHQQHSSTASRSRQQSYTSVSDFSSPTYWSTRFSNETSFEWLLPSAQIIPFIVEHLDSTFLAPTSGTTNRRLKGIHLGCGTSGLGPEVQLALKERYPEMEVDIVNADYVADSISAEGVLSLDCLDEEDVLSKAPEGGWDMLLDKSTADAISCGPLIYRRADTGKTSDLVTGDLNGANEAGEEPLFVLLRNMARASRPGANWISISYSSSRYHQSDLQGLGWAVVERRFLASTSLPEGRKVRDGKTGEERVVWEPETGVWGWVLERM